jgi:hypothetical protein
MFAASFESALIFLLIAAASAFFNWIKKQSETSSADWKPEPPPRPRNPTYSKASASSAKPQATSNWEEELRRMLENAAPTTRNPSPPRIPQQPRTATPPKTVSASSRGGEQSTSLSVPKIFSEQKFYKAHCNYCDGHIEFPASAMDEVVPCPFCHKPTVLRPFEMTPVEVLAHQNVSADFATTEKTYEEASQLSQRVAAHMQGVVQNPVGRTGIEVARKPSREIVRAELLFKNSRRVREAIVASVILGPPRAFEEM